MYDIVYKSVHVYWSSFLHDELRGTLKPLLVLLKELGPDDVGVFLNVDATIN